MKKNKIQLPPQSADPWYLFDSSDDDANPAAKAVQPPAASKSSFVDPWPDSGDEAKKKKKKKKKKQKKKTVAPEPEDEPVSPAADPPKPPQQIMLESASRATVVRDQILPQDDAAWTVQAKKRDSRRDKSNQSTKQSKQTTTLSTTQSTIRSTAQSAKQTKQTARQPVDNPQCPVPQSQSTGSRPSLSPNTIATTTNYDRGLATASPTRVWKALPGPAERNSKALTPRQQLQLQHEQITAQSIQLRQQQAHILDPS